MTHNYYGSCSGCDTLKGIRDMKLGYLQKTNKRLYDFSFAFGSKNADVKKEMNLETKEGEIK